MRGEGIASTLTDQFERCGYPKDDVHGQAQVEFWDRPCSTTRQVRLTIHPLLTTFPP
jgi:hypothetical protein